MDKIDIKKLKMYVLDRLRDAQATGELPDAVRFSTYENDQTLARFHPTEEWPGGAAEHERVMFNIAAAISREFPNVQVDITPISEEEYRGWLDECGLEDSPEIRAKHVSEVGNDNE